MTLFETLVTVAAGGTLTLAGTWLNGHLTAQRERRDSIDRQREERVQRYRIEYMAALEAVSASVTGALTLAAILSVKRIVIPEEAVKLLQVSELFYGQFRLELLPLPPEILSGIYEITRRVFSFVDMLDSTHQSAQAKELETLATKLSDAMRQHLAELDQPKQLTGRKLWGRV